MEAEELSKSLNSYFQQELLKMIPKSTKVDIPDDTSKKETKKKISSANEKVAKDVMRIFSDSEKIRLNLQKPVFKAVVFLFALQVMIFNAIIVYLVYKVIGCGICSIKSTPELFTALLDFLKYYIGAVVVEIIGLVAVIIKSTFSLHPSKLVSELLHGDK